MNYIELIYIYLFIVFKNNKKIYHSNSGNQAPRNPASSMMKKAVSFSLPPYSSASSSSSRFGYASIGSQRQRLIFKLMGIHSPDGKF